MRWVAACLSIFRSAAYATAPVFRARYVGRSRFPFHRVLWFQYHRPNVQGVSTYHAGGAAGIDTGPAQPGFSPVLFWRGGQICRRIRSLRSMVFTSNTSLNILDLRTTQLIVKNDNIDIASFDEVPDLFQFSFAHKCAAVGMRKFLHKALYGFGASGFGQKCQLIQVFGYLFFGL